MSEIPYRFYKVADISEVADSEKTAGAVFFDDATQSVTVYGAEGIPKVYGTRKWEWNGINVTEFVKNSGVGDALLWTDTTLMIVARKDTSVANYVTITLIADKGFNTLKFRTNNGGSTFTLESSIEEGIGDKVDWDDVTVNTASNTIVQRDENGNINVHHLIDDGGLLYALPNASEEVQSNADHILQEKIDDIDEIRTNANDAIGRVESASHDASEAKSSAQSALTKAEAALPRAGGTMTGTITSRTIAPSTASTYNIGSEAKPYKSGYFGDIQTDVIKSKGSVYVLPNATEEDKESADGVLLTNQDVLDLTKDLTGKIEPTDAKFIFRASGGDRSIKDESAVIRKILGNTVVHNQLFGAIAGWEISDPACGSVLYGVDASATINITKGGVSGLSLIYNGDFSLVQGHKYIVIADVLVDKANAADYFDIVFGNTESHALTPYVKTANVWTRVSSIFTASNTFSAVKLVPHSGYASATITSGSYKVRHIQCVDLTKMFGEGNEPTTLAEYTAYRPKAYYEYNDGEVMPMAVNTIKTVGFNIIETTNAIGGVFSNDGTSITANDHYSIATARVIGGEKYYFKDVCNSNYYPTCVIYDSAQNILQVGRLSSTGTVASGYITMPENAYTLRVCYNNLYANSCCVNLSHSGIRDGEYEPFESGTLPLPEVYTYFPEGMNGVNNVVDEINENYAIRSFGLVDLGTLTWAKSSTTGSTAYRWQSTGLNSSIKIVGNAEKANVMCSKYCIITSEETYYYSKVGIAVGSNGFLYLYDEDYKDSTDASAFKTSLSGVFLCYELATPIVTKISTPMQLDYWVEDFGTEEAISRDEVSAPFRAEVVYQFNAIDRIRDNERNIERLEAIVDAITTTEAVVQTTSIVEEENMDVIIRPNVANLYPTMFGNVMCTIVSSDNTNVVLNEWILRGQVDSTTVFNWGAQDIRWLNGESIDLSSLTFSVVIEVILRQVSGYEPYYTGEFKIYKQN